MDQFCLTANRGKNFVVILAFLRALEIRDGAGGGAWGVGAPQNFTEPPPSALEFLKISVHCQHFRNLLVMFLESVVAF